MMTLPARCLPIGTGLGNYKLAGRDKLLKELHKSTVNSKATH